MYNLIQAPCFSIQATSLGLLNGQVKIDFFTDFLEIYPLSLIEENGHQNPQNISKAIQMNYEMIKKMDFKQFNNTFQNITLNNDIKQIQITVKTIDGAHVKQFLGIRIPQMNFKEHYQILEKIRQGGQGQVFKCLCYADKSVYAAKILNNTNKYTHSELEIQKILAKNPHKHVLSMQEFFVDACNTFIIFPLILGGTLYSYLPLQKENRKLINIKKTLKQLLKGLEHIHNLGLIHRDIKMDNIMMEQEPDERIMIIDFGFAVQQSKTNLFEDRAGTLEYMAPEILNEEEYDEKSDIFSLAQVFHILVTGQAFKIKSPHISKMDCKNRNLLYIDKNKINEPALFHLFNNMIKKKSSRFSATQCLNHEYFQKKQISDRVICLKSLKFKSPFSPENSPKS